MIRKEFLMPKIKLQGRVFIKGGIRVVTGLHIGGGSAGVQIGQIDNIVVRDPLTMMPYIPGSSIKGKMRSLSEKLAGLDQNTQIGSVLDDDVFDEVCKRYRLGRSGWEFPKSCRLIESGNQPEMPLGWVKLTLS